MDVGCKLSVKMKFYLVLILFFLFPACNKISESDLEGAWTLVESTPDESNITDSIVFRKPDTFRLYIFQDQRPVDSIFEKFHLNRRKSKLATLYGKMKYEFDIVKLTDSSLHMKEYNTNYIQQYRRLSN